jgi:hypothetical protein
MCSYVLKNPPRNTGVLSRPGVFAVKNFSNAFKNDLYHTDAVFDLRIVAVMPPRQDLHSLDVDLIAKKANVVPSVLQKFLLQLFDF